MALVKPMVPATAGQVQKIQAGDYVDPAVLGSGTANSTTVLHGDNVYRAPAGGGSSIPDFILQALGVI